MIDSINFSTATVFRSRTSPSFSEVRRSNYTSNFLAGPRSRYHVQAEGVTVCSCRPTQPKCSCTPSPMDTDGPFHGSESRRQMATDPWSTTKDLLLPELGPAWGQGTPFSPCPFTSPSFFCSFLLFPSLVGFNYFLLLFIPFLSTRIVQLRFQAGGRRSDRTWV